VETCPQCGAKTPTSDIDAHNYFEASNGCWAAYGTILAREYSNPAFFRNHRQTVDAYALQHPAGNDPRAVQSVNIHLIALTLLFSADMPSEKIPTIMSNIIQKTRKPSQGFLALSPPSELGKVTVADILPLTTLNTHLEGVDDWARQVWSAWENHHDVAWEYIHAEDIK